MPRFVAFLRAINVGGRVVKMERLRTLFDELPFEDVATFIASGNVIFTTRARGRPKLEATIEDHLHRALGYDVATFLRTPLELSRVVDHQPFGVEPEKRKGESLHVAFLKKPPTAAGKRATAALQSDVDELACVGSEVYWFRRTRLGESQFSGAALERALQAPATLRNTTTVRKLAEKYG